MNEELGIRNYEFPSHPRVYLSQAGRIHDSQFPSGRFPGIPPLRRFAPSVWMTSECVIPSEAEGRVEESGWAGGIPNSYFLIANSLLENHK